MRYAIVALLALAVAACANRKNPYYCDESSDCSHLRGESFCDIDALLPGSKLRNTCVAPPEGEQCNRAQVCKGAARPQCSDSAVGSMGTCVECTLNEHCEGNCDTESHTCLPPITACTPGSAGDVDCASADTAKPYCAATDTCAECAESVHCEQASASVCDAAEFSCRACQAHPECGSLFCELDSGLCAESASLIYVDVLGSGALCTQALPCNSFAIALTLVTAQRNRIVVAEGEYTQQIVIDDLNLEIIGIGAARFVPTLGSDENALTVTGTSEVAVSGLEFSPSAAASNTDVIRCDGSSASLSIERVGIFDSRDLGVLVTDCDLRINASKIIGNDGGGIFVMGSGDYSITNTVIAHNVSGTNNPAVNLSSNGNQQRFDFNTVVGNQSAGATAGVACSTVPALQGSGNIIYGNIVGAAVSGNCLWQHSDVEGIAATNNNIDLDPQLVNNSAFGDYHLRSTSPCIDAADTEGPSTDIDGEVRPQGSASDIGADESQ